MEIKIVDAYTESPGWCEPDYGRLLNGPRRAQSKAGNSLVFCDVEQALAAKDMLVSDESTICEPGWYRDYFR